MFTFRRSVLTFLRIIGETIQDKAVGMEIVKISSYAMYALRKTSVES